LGACGGRSHARGTKSLYGSGEFAAFREALRRHVSHGGLAPLRDHGSADPALQCGRAARRGKALHDAAGSRPGAALPMVENLSGDLQAGWTEVQIMAVAL
jgi:hypothetical protein